MSLITGNSTDTKWYIESANGLIGPFNTPQEANLTKLNEGHNGNVVQRTNSGQSMLLG